MIYIYTYIYNIIYIYMYTYINIYLCLYIYMYMYIFFYSIFKLYIYTDIRIHIFIYIDTHMYKNILIHYVTPDKSLKRSKTLCQKEGEVTINVTSERAPSAPTPLRGPQKEAEKSTGIVGTSRSYVYMCVWGGGARGGYILRVCWSPDLVHTHVYAHKRMYIPAQIPA